MKIDLIIPNYNGASILKKNLQDIIENSKDFVNKFIIVDDGSDKNDLAILREYLFHLKNDKVVLIEQQKNKGFSSTVNKGIKHSNAEYVLLLNSDVVPRKGYIKYLLEDFEADADLFAVGCMDKSIEGARIVLRGRGVGLWRRGFLIHKKGDTDDRNTLWVSGGSSMFKREGLESLGYFDEVYDPFYWEDIDLSYRALKAGMHIVFENRSMVTHKHQEGAIKNNYSSKEVKTIAFRNQFIFVWKNLTDTKTLLSHFLWLPYHIVKALLRLDTPFFKGLILALRKIPDIMLARRKQKLINIKSDEEIIISV